MRKAVIIGIIMALAATALAEEKPKEPTKAELQTDLKQVSTEYQLIQAQRENLAYRERDILKRAQEIQAALKKLDEKAKDEKGNK